MYLSQITFQLSVGSVLKFHVIPVENARKSLLLKQLQLEHRVNFRQWDKTAIECVHINRFATEKGRT